MEMVITMVSIAASLLYKYNLGLYMTSQNPNCKVSIYRTTTVNLPGDLPEGKLILPHMGLPSGSKPSPPVQLPCLPIQVWPSHLSDHLSSL